MENMDYITKLRELRDKATPDTEGVRLKYRQLAREIAERDSWSNLDHSMSKLGIFLAELFREIQADKKAFLTSLDLWLELAESSEELEKFLPCGPGVTAEEIKAWANWIEALAKLKGES